MHIVSIALGGCLKPEPVRYGITEDTGGHITYILGEMTALAQRDDVTRAEIVTRLFEGPGFDAVHAMPSQKIGEKLSITRIDSGNRAYLAKEALSADRQAFTRALVENFRARTMLPDIIHAHFADAADVAAAIEKEFGIPFIYTAHSLAKDKVLAMGGAERPANGSRIAEEGAAIRRASAIIGSSRDECERQVPAYDPHAIGKTHRIAPGVTSPQAFGHDIEAARALISPFLRDLDKPMLLAVARPVHKKNLVRLVDAFGSSPRLRARCNLVILAGLRDTPPPRGSEEAEVHARLLAAIDRHDLYGKVAYPRSHTRAEVGGLYALASETRGVFVNPALMEPYGLTLIEAASYGLPVVATRVGGPLDILAELEHGSLVDPTSATEIAVAVEALIDDAAAWDRCSSNARTRVEAMSWDAYAAAFVAVARSINNRAPRVADYRHLVVSDIDNTLTGCVDGAARFAGFFIRRAEFGFAVATGRSLVEARRLVREWRLPRPAAWITSVGSEIYWDRGGTLQVDASFAQMIARDWDAEAVAEACAKIDGLEPQAPYEQRSFKRSYIVRRDGAVDEVRHNLARAGLEARVIFSHGDMLDVLPARAGKGAAMRHVAAALGIAPEQVFAAGDSGNDEDMLSECENAILVGNHSHEIASLRAKPNVYVARRSHGAGALEGVLTHRRLRRRSLKAVAVQ